MTELETMLLQSLKQLTTEYENQAATWQNQYLDLKNQNEVLTKQLAKLETLYTHLCEQQKTILLQLKT